MICEINPHKIRSVVHFEFCYSRKHLKVQEIYRRYVLYILLDVFWL